MATDRDGAHRQAQAKFKKTTHDNYSHKFVDQQILEAHAFPSNPHSGHAKEFLKIRQGTVDK